MDDYFIARLMSETIVHRFEKVDIDHEQKTAAQFQITSVPTMVLIKDGKEVNRLVGLRDANAIRDFILSVT